MTGPNSVPVLHGSWFALLTEETDVRLIVLDQDFRIRFLTAAASKFFGFPRDEYVGRSAYDVMPREYADERREINDKVIQTRSPITLMETLRGWRCRTRICYFGLDDAGKHLVAAVFNPQALQPLSEDGPPIGEVVHARVADAVALARLSKAEIRVLTMIGDGLSTQDMADRTGRSIKTIEGHRFAIGRKLGATNRVELARIAIRAGLSSLELRPEESPKAREEEWVELSESGPRANGVVKSGRG